MSERLVLVGRVLEHELHEESVMRASLEEALSSHKIDFVKTDDALQLALENKDALKIRVEKLLVDHTRLRRSLKRARASP